MRSYVLVLYLDQKGNEMAQGKPKRSLFDKFINIFCFLIIIWFCSGEVSHLYRDLDTIKAAPELYEHNYSISTTFPFVGSYYLMKPKNYDPKYKYPLVIVLHGISKHAYAAAALAHPKFRNAYPFFVMVPIAPKRAFWVTPKDTAYQMKRNIPYPDHLPQVIAGIKDIKTDYRIDENKIVITGHSMGATGVIGALEHYPDIFDAGIASSGAWSPNEISNIKVPLFIFHGTKDRAVPYQNSLGLRKAAKMQKKPIQVEFLKGQGHGIGNMVYSNTRVWNDVLKVIQ